MWQNQDLISDLTVQGFVPRWNIYQLLHPELGSMKDLTVVWGIFPSLQEVTDFEDRKISGRNSDQDPAGHDGDGG